MAIYCPYCAHKLKVEGVRPGKFVPACPDCGGKFVLKVPQNLADKWEVGALKSELESGRSIAAPPGKKKPQESTSEGGADAAEPSHDLGLDLDLDLDLDMGLEAQDQKQDAGKGKAAGQGVAKGKPQGAESGNAPAAKGKLQAAAPVKPAKPVKPGQASSKPAKPVEPAKADDEDDLDSTMASLLSSGSAHDDDSDPGIPSALPLDVADNEEEDRVAAAADDDGEDDAIDQTLPSRPATPRDKRSDTAVLPSGGKSAPSRPQAPPSSATPAAQDVGATMPSTRPPSAAASAPQRPVTAPAKPPKPPVVEAEIIDATLLSDSKLAEVPEAQAIPPSVDLDATAPSGLDLGASESLDEADIKSVVATAVVESTMPATLNGYQIVKELGRGGMGAVYMARQLSLDRAVAVKVMNPQWANNPTFLSRFTREAYAAAQLVHHNVVQIYDIGEDKSINYFSMEFVEGKSLGNLLDEQGKLDPEVAVGYILQAARGLKFAHERGMIHRDVKPDNLMLNEHGIVKVADLGLVKTPDAVAAEEKAAKESESSRDKKADKRASLTGANVTQANVAMGTPMYMAPEQAQDAAHVDARADIYSLGCTLYTLVTGRPVFEGKTVAEVLTKHATEQVVPPEVIVKRVPKALSGIIMKMVAKPLDERYQSMDEVIKDLQQFLGLETSGPFTPKEEHAEKLEAAVKQYNTAKTAKLRKLLVRGFALGMPVLIVLSGVLSALLAGGLLGLYLLSFLAYFTLTGITEKTFVFRKFRQLVFTNSIGDWLMWLLGAALAVGGLVIFNLHWWWLGFCIAAVGIALGFHFGIDRKLRSERRPIVDDIEKMLKSMRLFGLEEDAIRQFVCKYAGDQWEEFYEALFGYESKLEARQRWGKGQRGENRKKHAAWRDGLVSWIEARMKAREEARQRKHLQKIEARSLQAQGKSAKEAAQEAQKNAQVLVAAAAQMKQRDAEELTLPGTRAPAAAPQAKHAPQPQLKAMLDPSNPNVPKIFFEDTRVDEGWLAKLFGGRGRFVLGALLLGLCLLWLHQNNLLNREQVAGIDARQVNTEQARELASGWWKQVQKAKPVALPMVPEVVTTPLSSLNTGLAGLILLFSSLFRGVRVGVLALAAAAVAIVGNMFIPPLGPLNPTLSSGAIAIGVAVLGLFMGKRRKAAAKPKVGEELLDKTPAKS